MYKMQAVMQFRNILRHFPQASIGLLAHLFVVALNVADIRPDGQVTITHGEHDKLAITCALATIVVFFHALAIARTSSAHSANESLGKDSTAVIVAARRASSSITVLGTAVCSAAYIVLVLPMTVTHSHINLWSYMSAFTVALFAVHEAGIQNVLLPTGQGLPSVAVQNSRHMSTDGAVNSLSGHGRVLPHAVLARSARQGSSGDIYTTRAIALLAGVNIDGALHACIPVAGAAWGLTPAAVFALLTILFHPSAINVIFNGSAATFLTSDSDEDSHESNGIQRAHRASPIGFHAKRLFHTLTLGTRGIARACTSLQQRTMWLQYSFPKTPRSIKAAFKREIKSSGIGTNLFYLISQITPFATTAIGVPAAICAAAAAQRPEWVFTLTDHYEFHALCGMAQLSAIVVILYFGAQFDTAIFRAAITAAEAEKENSTSLLRWLSHECRSPVAAAALAVDEIMQEDLPSLQLLLRQQQQQQQQQQGNSEGLTAPLALQRQRQQQDHALSSLTIGVKMVQQPIKSLSSVLDNMLQYLRRQHKQPAIEQLMYVQVAEAWRTAWTNACASRDVEPFAITSSQPAIYLHMPVRATMRKPVLGGADALQALDGMQVITSVTQATLLQVMTNYATNALKYGHGGADSARIELKVTMLHDSAAARCASVHASHMKAARSWLTQTLQQGWQEQQSQAAATASDGGGALGSTLPHAGGAASDGQGSSERTMSSSRTSVVRGRSALKVLLPERRVSAASNADDECTAPQLLSPAVVQIEVIDYGAGLDAAELDSLFHPFARLDSGTAAAGNGLGLWLMRQLVESQGGTVSARSKGKSTGCSFSLAFPALLSVGEDYSKRSSAGGSCTLVMDDSALSPLQRSVDGSFGLMKPGHLRGQHSAAAIADYAADRALQHSQSCPQAGKSRAHPPAASSNPSSSVPLSSAAKLPTLAMPVVLHVSKDTKGAGPARGRKLGMLRALQEESESKSASFTPDDGVTVEHAGVMSGTPRPPGHRCSLPIRVSSEEGGGSPQQRVLLVEDTPSIRIMLQRQLKRFGYHVDVAHDGRDGLDKWLQAAQGGGSTAYHAVVTDMTMPRMNGDEMVRQIHLACVPASMQSMVEGGADSLSLGGVPFSDGKGLVGGQMHVPLLVGVTGNVLPEDIEHFKLSGAQVVLTKPASGRDVHDVLSWHSGGGAGNGEGPQGLDHGSVLSGRSMSFLAD